MKKIKEEKIILTFDGAKKEFPKGITGIELAKKLGIKDALAIKVDDELKDLTLPIEKNAKIKLLTFADDEGKDVFRHSAAHILAQAILRLYPEAKPTIGPPIENGFYYDFDDLKITHADFEKIEAEIRKIIEDDYKFERKEVSLDEARELFKNNKYKIELAEEFSAKGLTIYRQGEFIDLCHGPQVLSTGLVKAIKLTEIAAAYWRGDPKNPQLTRIYGTAFPSEAELSAHLKLLEEIKNRDHRRIGKNLDLWYISDLAPGSPFFLPKGVRMVNELIAFLREELRERGYKEIITPFLLNKNLWVISGHWEHYRENMFLTKIGEEDFALKPMNCPGAIIVFNSTSRSYKELPLKLAEFGIVHRAEVSGALSGLFRVRRIIMDDAHIFCSLEQIKQEIKELIELVKHVYGIFGFEYKVELSTRPENYLGTLEQWNKAEDALIAALNEEKIEYKINPGGGAFYGPKIDFHIKDCLGRYWQCATIQVDFQMPERFDISYVAEDGNKRRAVIIHRAILGSMERFLAIITEHFAGKFPLWISPEQVRVLTVSEKFENYGQKVLKTLLSADIRATLDSRPLTINKKIREAQLDQVNYILVVGAKEEGTENVTIRRRDNVVVGTMHISKFLEKIKEEIKTKSLSPLIK